ELRRLVAGLNLSETSPELLFLLGQLLPDADREALLRSAQSIYPGDFWLNFHLGTVLSHFNESGEGVEFLRVALALQPRSEAVLTNLGNALRVKGKPEEALIYLRRALQIAPEHSGNHNSLGVVLLLDRKEVDLAIVHFRTAILLWPKNPAFHHNL